MTSRKRRHTRSTFADLVHPNFEELSREYPDFGRSLQVVRKQQKERGGSFASNVTQDFSIATTKALLHTYFSLTLPEIPTLCPPIPNRYFFVRWISQDLLPLMAKESYFGPIVDQGVTPRTHYGIDLGTGATCIYPLLFSAPDVKLEDHDSTIGIDWKWLASEVDQTSVGCATQNVKANHLDSKIAVVHVTPTDRQGNDASADKYKDSMSDNDVTDIGFQTGPLRRLLETLPRESRPSGVVDVVITNPPFHPQDSTNIVEPLREGDQRMRTSRTKQEASYPGGEANFVIDMVVDSLNLLPGADSEGNDQTTMTAKWLTSMFGKKTSWNQLKGALTYMLGPARVQATEFGPGHLTRWFLAWTYFKPNVRSPLAVFQHNRRISNKKDPIAGNLSDANQRSVGCLLSFDVTLQDENNISRGLMEEVVNRVVAYLRELRTYSLHAEIRDQDDKTGARTVTIREETPRVEEWNERQLPPPILNALRARKTSFMEMLPCEGHFLMDVSIRARNSTTATVSLTAFVHSQYGRKAVEKIEGHLQAEVCRTTRRWRRLMERQRAQKEEQPQPMES